MANPDAKMTDLEVFKGSVVTRGNLHDQKIVWNPMDSANKVPIFSDSLQNIYDSIAKEINSRRVITFNLKFSNWCNLDAYFNKPNGAPVKVIVPNSAANLDTRVFLMINRDNLKGFYVSIF